MAHSYQADLTGETCRTCRLRRAIVSMPVPSEAGQFATRSRRTWRRLDRVFAIEPRCSTVQKLDAGTVH